MATWTQTDIDKLKAAIATGHLTVKFADRSVTYQSLSEMRALLASMQQDVAAAGGTASYILLNTRKGF